MVVNQSDILDIYINYDSVSQRSYQISKTYYGNDKMEAIARLIEIQNRYGTGPAPDYLKQDPATTQGPPAPPQPSYPEPVDVVHTQETPTSPVLGPSYPVVGGEIQYDQPMENPNVPPGTTPMITPTPPPSPGSPAANTSSPAPGALSINFRPLPSKLQKTKEDNVIYFGGLKPFHPPVFSNPIGQESSSLKTNFKPMPEKVQGVKPVPDVVFGGMKPLHPTVSLTKETSFPILPKPDLKTMTPLQVTELLKIYAEYKKYNINPKTGEPDWNKIPVEDRKYYPGAKEYFASLTDEEKVNMIGKDKINSYIKKYQQQRGFGWIKDPTLRDRILFYADKYSKNPKTKDWALSMGVAEALWENITLEDPNSQYYSRLSTLERSVKSWGQSARQFVTGVATFPLAVAEKFGVPVKDIPVVGKAYKGYQEWEQRQSVGPSGLLGYGMAHIPILGSSEEERKKMGETMAKYPVETAAATFGEITGAFAGANVANIGKTTIVRGLNKIPQFKPTITKLSTYTPSNLLRKLYVKTRGLKEVSHTEYLGVQDSSGFVHSTPAKTMAGFKAQPGTVAGTYKFVHATGAKWKSGKIIPAKTGKGARPTEMSGVSISPKGMGQSRFLRVEADLKPSYSSKITLFPKLKRPTIISGEYPVKHLPKSIRKSTPKATEYMLKNPESAYIATKHYMRGFEPEAKISPGVSYKKIGTPEYFKLKGKVVMVDVYQFGKTTFAQKIKTGAKGIFTSYSYGSRPTFSLSGAFAKSAIGSSSFNYNIPSYPKISVSSFNKPVSYTKTSVPSSKTSSYRISVPIYKYTLPSSVKTSVSSVKTSISTPPPSSYTPSSSSYTPKPPSPSYPSFRSYKYKPSKPDPYYKPYKYKKKKYGTSGIPTFKFKIPDAYRQRSFAIKDPFAKVKF